MKMCYRINILKVSRFMTELAFFHAKHIQSTSQSDGYYMICIYIILLEMQSII